MENNSNIDHSRLEWLIRAYQIKDNGDGRIRINIRPGEETLKVIRTHKAEIMQILHEMEAQENKQRELARMVSCRGRRRDLPRPALQRNTRLQLLPVVWTCGVFLPTWRSHPLPVGLMLHWATARIGKK